MGILCSRSEGGWAQLKMEVIKAPSVQFNLFRKTYFLLQVLSYIHISNWCFELTLKSKKVVRIDVNFVFFDTSWQFLLGLAAVSDISTPIAIKGGTKEMFQQLFYLWFKSRNWWPTPVLSRAWKCNWKGGITRLHASGRQSIQSTHLTSNGQRTSVCLSLI